MNMQRQPGRTGNDHQILQEIAEQAMTEKGLLPEFSPAAEKQLDTLNAPAQADGGVRDLRNMIWCSIDNDDSKDLDQLTFAEDLGNGRVRALVAVADVDALVSKGTPIDEHAAHNTTSVYTAARIFPMLPEKLSTGLTSLNEGQERVAMVIDMVVNADGSIDKGEIYRARVLNKAQLTYNGVGDFLGGETPPQKAAKVPGLLDNLKLQDRIADKMRDLRHEHGALDLETIEARPVFHNGSIADLQAQQRNNATMLIEDFMIAANGVTAGFLAGKGVPSLRRVVRTPERWDRIVKIAEEHGERLPGDPDAQALEAFLVAQRKRDPLRFPDLSLAIVKSMGAGEYIVEMPGQTPVGHFGLAVKNYTHSTAPNRRFPDLVAHRLVKAVLANGKQPYTRDELQELAAHCTEQEDAANKVERRVRKSAAALLLASKIGERFDAIVTGAADKGTWVRIFHPPVEGKLVHGFENLDIGNRLRVKLVGVDVERGFIDFARTH